jgi:glutaminyl-peptide cyclotransferase
MLEEPPKQTFAFHRRTLAVALTVLLAGGAVGAWVLFGDHGTNGRAIAAGSNLKLEDIPFDGAQAYEYLKQLCAIGPRPSGSPGMAKQQKVLAAHFEKLGGQVEFQRFSVPHPQGGERVPMANIIVRWNPKATDRILLCAHYDTLPYPLRDRRNPRGVFVGANDNASGVALLMELANDMPKLATKYGVDFVLLDGEEFIFDENGRFFLGAEFFAREYAQNRPCRYLWGILLDMVGDADLQIRQEYNSVWWQDTRPLVEQVWAVAARLGVREFVSKRMQDGFSDDHIMLHNVGQIPCIDVIDFDYPAWHTEGDTPKQCSPLSLAKVGWVIREWLKTVE